MHGCTSGLAPLVNAEVDSMGGVVDGGVAIGIKASPRRAAIEKAQAELRQEYDVREERRKELEYLEKGGNPLDFKLHNAASISVQSTSLADQHPEQFVTSEAKGSFALTASPRGDSVESIGRPGASTYCEPNSADNLLLFDGENEFIEAKIAPSKQSSQFDGSQNVKESGDSTALGVPKNQAYRRRNRSKPNRDGARSSSADKAQSRGGNVSSLLSRHVLKDAKGAGCEPNNLKDPNVSLNSDAKPLSNMVVKAAHSNNQLEMELDGVRAAESASRTTKEGLLEAASDIDPICLTSGGPESVGVAGSEHVISASIEPPCLATTKVEYQTSSVQQNGFSNMKGDVKGILNEGQNNNVAFGMKGLDSESSCTHTGLSLDEKNDSDLCTNLRNIDSNGMTKEHSLVIDGESHMEVEEMVKEKNEIKVDGNCAVVISGNSNQDSGSIPNVKEDLLGRGSSLQNEMKHQTNIEGIEVIEPYGISASEAERNPSKLLGDNFNPWKENACTRRRQVSVDSFVRELPETTLPVRCSAVVPEQQTSSGIHLKLANKAHEDNILEEARVIETKRKRIAELSVDTLPLENRRRSHWDFVLEEMAWLANDFAQERLWKITASAQICHRVAFASRLRFAGQNICWEHKKVAHTLAKAIMEFWHSAETSKEPELRCPEKKLALAVRAYAVRFLKTNHSNVPIGQAEVPVTPESMSDLGILEMSWEDRLTEENLFYTVLPGAMETYRTSIESYLVQCEKTSSSMQEEVETSVYDAVADLGSQEIAYEEDEGETGTYFTSEGTKSSKFTMKKRKNLTKSYVARSYELGADLALMQQSVLVGKRRTHTLNAGSIPTKRVRTASRLRVISPFSVGNSGCFQAPNKTDASSGDTNSFQDDQSTLHAGSQIRNNLEVESVGDFEKQLPFDSAEVSTKHRKKKKAKHLGSTYEPRWQLDSNFQNEQRDHSRKRFESHQLESNGSSGLFNMKKPKMMKQSLDNSFDNLTPIAGSIPSPVTSQMSNMSNPDKIIKLLGGRDRGRNAKALKMPAGQPESGSPWSLFEDQALVVLVHDMGPNWRLVSDAINSTLQLKCIFRKPKDCKERHKVLMDRTTGDGADSAEDSGSSQPYPSTLPGIPKGSARQLFQRLQGPMEEETLKSHFGKIIAIGQKLHYRRIQNGNQDIKQILPHNSHADALSQVCPNNLNGGPPLMPLDLCDATASSLDALSHGYQGSHPSGSSISSQGSVAISNQGSPGMVLGSNFSSPSGPISASVRDHIYSVSRTASSPIDEQQRMQQYKQILSGRNIQKSSLPVPGALPGTDRSVRMLPGGNSTGTACGVNRSMPMARPGYQGIASPPVMNSGSMLSSSNVGMPSAVNMHSGAGPGQGISMLRPRDTVHMMRPTQDLEHQRQMMVPELHMQATQANIQGVPGFGGLSSVFSSQTAPPPVQAYPVHHHHHHHHLLQGSNPNHAANAQHQAYAIRIAKDRHLHQRLMQQQQQQQQQFSVSNALMPHVQSPPQLPISPSLPNSSQIQSQTFSPPVTISPLTSSSSMTPMSQHPQKHQMLTQGPTRNPQSGGSGLNSQIGKQRQRQPQQQQFQQSGRHHPQQRQLTESQQQAKRLKGIGRGTSLPNGLSTIPGSQAVDKAEQVMHLMHGQGLYPGSGLNPVQSSKPLVSTTHSPNHSQPQQKIYPGQTVPSSKQLQQVPSRSDNGNQGHIGPTLMTSSNHQHPQLHQKLANQTQPAGQRVVQPNRPTGSDPPSKLQSDQAQTGNTTAMPQVCTDKINIIPVVSSASTPQCIAPEPLYDSGVSNSATQLGPTGNLTNSSGSEPPTPIRQGLGRRQSSGSLASSPQQQEQESSQHELPPQQQSQQQTQHLQAENSSLYLGPSDSKLE